MLGPYGVFIWWTGAAGAPPVSATPPAPARLGDLIGPTPTVVVGSAPAILPGRTQL
jgi:hypothetical protein